MNIPSQFSAIAVVAACVVGIGAAPVATKPTLYMFGDSVSDTGMLQRLSMGAVPTSCYWEGRFSSGPVWSEYLALLLNFNLSSMATGGATSNGDLSGLMDLLPMDLSTNTTIIADNRRRSNVSAHVLRDASSSAKNSGQIDLSRIIDSLPEEISSRLPDLQTIDFQQLIYMLPQDIQSMLSDLQNIDVASLIDMIPEDIRSKIPNLEEIIASIVDIIKGNSHEGQSSLEAEDTSSSLTAVEENAKIIQPALGLFNFTNALDSAINNAKQAVTKIKSLDFSALIRDIPADLTFKIPSTQNQIARFKANNPDYANSSTTGQDVAIIEVGTTDVIVNMLSIASGSVNASNFVDSLVSTVVSQAEQLHEIGFKTIIIADLPSIQLTPLATMLNMSAVAGSVVSLYNQQLVNAVSAWAASATGPEACAIAELGKFTKMAASSAAITSALGVVDVNSACIGTGLLGLFQEDNLQINTTSPATALGGNVPCASPSTNYFFDLIHLGERMHRLLGYYFSQLVAAVSNGATLELTEQLVLSLVQQHNLGTPAPKPATV